MYGSQTKGLNYGTAVICYAPLLHYNYESAAAANGWELCAQHRSEVGKMQDARCKMADDGGVSA